MINPVKQGYATSVAVNNVDNKNKQTTNETQKAESNDKVSRIAEQIKNGTYKIDLGATSAVIADSLL